jgi:hypothetical protein
MVAGSTAITTDAMMEIVHRREPWTQSMWACVRKAAARWADRVTPRTRPLKWRAKDGVSVYRQRDLRRRAVKTHVNTHNRRGKNRCHPIWTLD